MECWTRSTTTPRSPSIVMRCSSVMPGPGARPELASPDELAEVKAICPGAVYVSEGGSEFVHLPTLKIPVGDRLETRDALLSLNPHTGYVSRLYLSAPIAGR